MRKVGRYKNKDIRIRDLHISETYANYLLFSKDAREGVNREIIDSDIGNKVYNLFGSSRPITIADHEYIDYKKRLPSFICYAWLVAREPIKQGSGSHLILVWLQNGNQDPFAVAAEKLENIDWEKHAFDFWL